MDPLIRDRRFPPTHSTPPLRGTGASTCCIRDAFRFTFYNSSGVQHVNVQGSVRISAFRARKHRLQLVRDLLVRIVFALFLDAERASNAATTSISGRRRATRDVVRPLGVQVGRLSELSLLRLLLREDALWNIRNALVV